MQDDECCPEFDPEKWDNKTLEWKEKRFIKSQIPAIFHFPVPGTINKAITRMWKQAEDAKKTYPDKKDTLILFTDPTPFRSEIYISVTGEVEGATNTTITGTFMTKVFDGPYNAIPRFIKEMDTHLESKDRKAKNYYVHYAYCPKCAKKYGHNHMILFAEI